MTARNPTTHIVQGDSILIENNNDISNPHIQVITAGQLNDNDIELVNCNVNVKSGGFVKAPEIRTSVIKDVAGNTTMTLSSTAIDFHSKTINNLSLSSGAVSASSVSSANGYASLDAELDALTTNKVSQTGHTASKIFVSTAGGGLTTGTINPADISTAISKLSGIEASADVTDTANVTSSGALMDSELSDLAGVKGVTISTLQVKPSEGAFANGDKTKLDAIEASADVTDTANVTSSGALMDSELTDLAGVKGVTISTLQVKPSEGAFVNGDKTKLNSALQNFNGLSTTSIFVGGGADKTANVDFSFVATAMNINPNDWKYLTLRTPTLSADKIIVLPSDAGTLQLVPSEGAFANGDKTKLDAIEESATADQTNAEIRAAVEAATNSNVFTDADHTQLATNTSKLSGIEASATADQTNAEIRAAVEAATDSNVFTDTDHNKLNGIEASATADQTNAEIRTAVENASDSNVFTNADHTKLNHITCTQSVDLDTMESNIATLDAIDGTLLTKINLLKNHHNNTTSGASAPAPVSGVDWFVTNAYFGCWNIYSAPSYGFFTMTTQAGSLPGYNSNYYPTLRTDYGNMYISVGGIYSGYFGTTSVGLIDFTGQHQALPVNEDLFNNVNDYIGKIVISNGDVSSIVKDESGNLLVGTGKKGITINESIPRVILCNTYKDKRVFGAISPEEEEENVKSMGNRETEKHFRQGNFVSVVTGLPAEDNRIFINAVGEGAIWVINSHGNIENGDYICSSNKGEGYGCLQDDDLLHNYTCAKATINCTFDLLSEEYECKEILVNGENLKIAFIACVYVF